MALTLDDLKPAPGSRPSKNRVGRGPGSGKGKTAGRGQKGQKARTHAGVGRGFEGGQLPIQKRMPYKRGFTNIFKPDWEVVNVDRLQDLAGSGAITPESLHAAGVTRGLRFPVKVLGNGDLSAKVEVHAHAVSESAKAKIEAAGGSVVILERHDEWSHRRPRTRRIALNRDLKRARVGKVGGPTRKEAEAAIKAGKGA